MEKIFWVKICLFLSLGFAIQENVIHHSVVVPHCNPLPTSVLSSASVTQAQCQSNFATTMSAIVAAFPDSAHTIFPQQSFDALCFSFRAFCLLRGIPKQKLKEELTRFDKIVGHKSFTADLIKLLVSFKQKKISSESSLACMPDIHTCTVQATMVNIPIFLLFGELLMRIQRSLFSGH